MVSSCELRLDDIELTGQKAYVPEYLSGLFQEADRVEAWDKKYEVDDIYYRVTRDSLLMRLDLLGCTEALSRERFQIWRAETIRQEEDYQKETGDNNTNTLKALNSLTWQEWQRRVPDVLRTRFDLEKPDQFADEIDRNMRDLNANWLWFDGYESLLSIRAIIAACHDTKEVILDIGPLIGGGWIGRDERVCTKGAHVVWSRGQPTSPTIILAEGRSDIAILKASIKRFHPEVVDFFTFLDHSEFALDGGASFLVKFLKAFAAARVPANIVAVFDNDTAGLLALHDATALKLPGNIACIKLPDIELGRSYPTIGPQGAHEAEINGKAAGIELYLGRKSLTNNGTLRPVHWSGYDKRAFKYQGELDRKSEVQKEFLSDMQDGSVNCNDYPEMQLVWNRILSAAAKVAEHSQRLAPPRRHWW